MVRARELRDLSQMGLVLGKRFAPRLTWWARCFIFGVEDAAKYPFVLGLEGVDDAKKIQGGKFLAEALAEGPFVLDAKKVQGGKFLEEALAKGQGKR